MAGVDFRQPNLIGYEDILAVGEKFGIRKSGVILKNINEAVRNFKHYADKYRYPAAKADVLLKLFFVEKP